MRSNLKVLASISVLLGAACAAPQNAPDPEEQLDPLVQPSEDLIRLAGFAGEYVIVDARRASDVAAPAMEQYEAPIGESLRFTRTGVELEGAACDDWQVSAIDEQTVPIEYDPNLADLTLAPADSPNSSGDQREYQSFLVTCEGEEAFRFSKVDDRVLAMPTANSAINLILERPLTELQIKAYQSQLKSMKFYHGDLTGILDEDTLRASRAWYEYRAQLDETQAIPARPAITANLLDTLRVFPDD